MYPICSHVPESTAFALTFLQICGKINIALRLPPLWRRRYVRRFFYLEVEKMEMKKIKIEEIKPYERNARKNDGAVDAVVKSIQQCEYIAPIILDETNVILAGHTRYKALKKLGYKEIECVVKEGLTEQQKKKYRLLDNKTNELAEWDFDLLAEELDGLDFGDLDLDWGIEETAKDESNHEEKEEMEEIKKLPESRIFVFCISAFGTKSECFTEIELEEQIAEEIIKKIKMIGASEVNERIKVVLSGV